MNQGVRIRGELEILAFTPPAIEDALRIFTFESNICQDSLTT